MQEETKSNESAAADKRLAQIVRSIIVELFEDEIHDLRRPKLTWTEAASQSFQKILPAIFEGESTNEVFLRPADLLSLARRSGAFGWIIKNSDASKLSATEARSERRAFGCICEKVTGLNFKNGVRFDSIGGGHSRRYRFTRPTP
jgi:hypothetical protein